MGERPTRLFDGPGDARARCRTIDWGATPLGPPADWPEALAIAVEIVLSQTVPSVVLWGPELTQIPNDAYRGLVGTWEAELVGRPAQSPSWKVLYERLLHEGPITAEETLALEARVTSSWAPVRDAKGVTRGAVVTLAPSPQSVEVDKRLATIGHELRTPLASIVLWADALRSGSVPNAEVGHALDAILVSARSQSQIIDDLVDLSRAASGKLVLATAPASIEGIARAALDVVRPMADQKRLRLELDVVADLGTAALDAPRMKRVLWNLLSNAIKSTPKQGRVVLRVRRGGGSVRYEIVETSEKRAQPGVGIGLELSRQLVELHGGTFAVSTDAKERAFRVELPCPDAVRPDSLRGMKVLVVEDDENARDVMCWTLERAGASVVAVGSGAQALAALGLGPGERPATLPELIVSDLTLPSMSGFELIARIGELCRAFGRNVPPACALSGLERQIDRDRAIAAGFDAYLTKPVTPQRLVQAVEQLAVRAPRAMVPGA